MNPFAEPQARCLCLVHDDRLVRSIVASVALELDLPPVKVFSSPDTACQQVHAGALMALMMLVDGQAALGFLSRLRAGELNWSSDTPLAILSPPRPAERIAELMAFKPARLLLTPFRVKDLILTLKHLPSREAALT